MYYTVLSTVLHLTMRLGHHLPLCILHLFICHVPCIETLSILVTREELSGWLGWRISHSWSSCPLPDGGQVTRTVLLTGQVWGHSWGGGGGVVVKDSVVILDRLNLLVETIGWTAKGLKFLKENHEKGENKAWQSWHKSVSQVWDHNMLFLSITRSWLSFPVYYPQNEHQWTNEMKKYQKGNRRIVVTEIF